ncbi:MAG TPA: DNA-3-methyladenine glycosylase 2 family protein [Saprospiraceae bacterium]|nr:DNA-3-methyladenine glycosylase 2 family protein [Saprospiraceae bacterium]HMP14059.1 DNA-3-methyladenine glycosylase 2 family protein [Saprospiraceae bacterium]
MIASNIIAHLSQDPKLAQVIQSTDYYEWSAGGSVYTDLIGSIISQQISVRAAATIQARFLGLFEQGYPEAKQVLALSEVQLREVGLSRQKAAYIRHIAEFFQRENLILYDWSEHADEDIIRQLTQIKGVGRWTVEMILMFTLNRPDVFPIDDLGIRNAMIRLYDLPESGKALRERLLQIAEPWRPWRTHACRYLWQWKDLPLKA